MIEVACGVVLDNNKVLITQRGDDSNYGKWEFPGGKVHEKESALTAIQRELMEELDLQVIPQRILDEYKHDHFLLKFILCRCTNKNQLRLHEHMSFRWVSLDQLMSFDFLSGDLPFIRKHWSAQNLTLEK